MNERKKIEDRLRKKELEVMGLEEQIKAARVYMQALQDVLKLLPKANETITLRPGSGVALARDIILKAGEPVHISAILEGMGKDASRENRASLTSSIAAYVRREEVFTRTAPNTFGLIELGHKNTSDDDAPEPPSDFGRQPEPRPPSLEEEEDIPF